MKQNCGQRGADENHEHDRVTQLQTRIQFLEGINHGLPHNGRVKQRA